MLREQFHAPLHVADLSFPQIEEQIRRCPSIILPIGALEPVGSDLPLGAINDCCDAIANALSIRLEVPVAPLLAYGNSTPFNAFGGSAGIHRDTMINVITECCKCWLFQGFQRIMVLSLAMDAQSAMASAAKRLCASAKRESAVRCCSLQEYEQFRALCASYAAGVEHGRSEWGIRAMARHLLPHTTAGVENTGPQQVLLDGASFKQWYRRGRDPEKLRKLAPAASFSSGASMPDVAEGGALFDRVTTLLAKEYTEYLTVKNVVI